MTDDQRKGMGLCLALISSLVVWYVIYLLAC